MAAFCLLLGNQLLLHLHPELNHSSSTLSTSASSEGETPDVKEKECGGEKGKREEKEDGGGAQEGGEEESKKKKVVDIAAFDLHLLLPGVAQPFDVTVRVCVCVSVSLVPRPFPLPVFHRFQYEIRRGKAWEIWSRAVTSGRQMVDTRGAVPNR